MNQLKLNPTARALLNPALLNTDAKRLPGLVYNSVRAQVIVDTIGGLLTPSDISGMKVKARIHTIRIVNWMVTGRTFDRVSAMCAAVICNSSASVINYDDFRYAIGGKGEGTTSIPGVSRSKLLKVINAKTTNMGTLTAQTSSAVGISGVFTAMGVTYKKTKNGFSVAPTGRDHPFLIAYAIELNKLSETSLIELFKDEDKDN